MKSLFLRRMWINQPSTLQEHHRLHGENVLATLRTGTFTQIYFTRGPCISMEIAEEALSYGWVNGQNGRYASASDTRLAQLAARVESQRRWPDHGVWWMTFEDSPDDPLLVSVFTDAEGYRCGVAPNWIRAARMDDWAVKPVRWRRAEWR